MHYYIPIVLSSYKNNTDFQFGSCHRKLLLPLHGYGHCFPKRKFLKKSVVKRSFQSSWFNQWFWLHYKQRRWRLGSSLQLQESQLWKTNSSDLPVLMLHLSQKDFELEGCMCEHRQPPKQQMSQWSSFELPATTLDVKPSLSSINVKT